jgi:D-tyrosyl-tRNA(Tyr) deacylase
VKAVIQRVTAAKVTVGGETVGEIGAGLLLFLGVAPGDARANCDYLAEKILNLRIFEDAGGHFNHSLLDVQGELLVVSQFTLLADARRGRRPSFAGAAPPELAAELYEYFIEKARASAKVATGRFGARMLVEIANDGPVTLILEDPPAPLG